MSAKQKLMLNGNHLHLVVSSIHNICPCEPPIATKNCNVLWLFNKADSGIVWQAKYCYHILYLVV